MFGAGAALVIAALVAMGPTTLPVDPTTIRGTIGVFGMHRAKDAIYIQSGIKYTVPRDKFLLIHAYGNRGGGSVIGTIRLNGVPVAAFDAQPYSYEDLDTGFAAQPQDDVTFGSSSSNLYLVARLESL
jgi:hypothetical protein